MIKNGLLAFVLFGLCVGCGIKGDPLPPVEQESAQKKSIEILEKKNEPVVVEKPVDKKNKKKKVSKDEN